MISIRKSMLLQQRKAMYRKPMTLDPVLANLKDQATKPAKDYNWNTLVPELRKFNIRVTKDMKLAIVNEAKHELLTEILMKLRDFDTEVLVGDGLVENGGDQPSLRKKLLRNESDNYIHKTEEKEAMSEYNFNNIANPIERAARNREDAESNMNILLNESKDNIMAQINESTI